MHGSSTGTPATTLISIEHAGTDYPNIEPNRDGVTCATLNLSEYPMMQLSGRNLAGIRHTESFALEFSAMKSLAQELFAMEFNTSVVHVLDPHAAKLFADELLQRWLSRPASQINSEDSPK